MKTELSRPLIYLKGLGSVRANLLASAFSLHTFGDLIQFYPLRYIDRASLGKLSDITPYMENIQFVARLAHCYTDKTSKGKNKLVAEFQDESTTTVQVLFFHGINWLMKSLKKGEFYTVWGKVAYFHDIPQLIHPEIEPCSKNTGEQSLLPVYASTETLKHRGLSQKTMRGYIQSLLLLLKQDGGIRENLPHHIIQEENFPSRMQAYEYIHLPPSKEALMRAQRRLKFEEFFFEQLHFALKKAHHKEKSQGHQFSKVGNLFHTFYQQYLPFSLTNAQQRVLKEIHQDFKKGTQMNRLLQGDVGSGKTIVALLCALLAFDNCCQCALIAPTEVLATQHYLQARALFKQLPVSVAYLSGGIKGIERRRILEGLERGSLSMVIGTHAILEEKIRFHNLGLAIIDEQHKFGVAQRAAIWKKNLPPPHILVMTATPIPRTLAMTVYGDLDLSILNELPPRRGSIQTVHRQEQMRTAIYKFIKEEIAKGRQAYIVFPLIEESEKLAYENLMTGYENLKMIFPPPKYLLSVTHGKQSSEEKALNMQRFAAGKTQIMVSTTVIEVGINVPNATVMVVENADKFGLSQLHQLRGRIGRGEEKSYCILLTKPEISKSARDRMHLMTTITDGFALAEQDLRLRGPGQITGTQQSGMPNYKLADIVTDKDLLILSKKYAEMIANKNSDLSSPEYLPIKNYLAQETQVRKNFWSKIS